MSESNERANPKNGLQSIVSRTQDDPAVRRALETTARMQQAYNSKNGLSTNPIGRSNALSSAHDPSMYDPALLAKVKEKYSGVPDGLIG